MNFVYVLVIVAAFNLAVAALAIARWRIRTVPAPRRMSLDPVTVARIKQARNVFCRGWRPIDAPGSRLIDIHTDGANR